MKKIFSLAIALIAFASVACAQYRVMEVNSPDGSFTQYKVDDVKDVTYSVYPWNLIGIGDYTFGYIAFYGEMDDMELWQSSDETTKYQIPDFLEYGYPMTFTYDESTGKVNVPEQDTGYYTYLTSGSFPRYTYYYGYIYIMEAKDFVSKYSELFDGLDETSAESYYDADSDTFNFALAYFFVSEDDGSVLAYYGYTGMPYSDPTYYQYETFEITSRASAPSKKSVAKKSDTNSIVSKRSFGKDGEERAFKPMENAPIHLAK